MRIALASVVLLSVLPVSTAAEVHWRKSTPLPDPRAGYAAGVLDGKLIIAGGSYWEGEKGHWVKKLFSARVDAFDPATQTWTRLPDMPVPLSYAASSVVDGQLYAAGGYDGNAVSSTVYKLGREGGKYRWRVAGKLPGPKVFAKAAAMGRTIALIGGMTRFEPYDAAGTCCTSVSATRDLLLFDTAHPERGWTAGPPYPGHERWLWIAEGSARSLWVAGGIYQNEAKGPTTRFDDVLRYDQAGGRWTRLGALPKEVLDTQSITSAMLGESILLVSFARKVWEMKLSPLEFQPREPLPEEAIPDGFFRIGSQVVGSGGENKIEGPRRRSEWTFIGTLN